MYVFAPTKVGAPGEYWSPDFSQDLVVEMAVSLCLRLLYPHRTASLPKHMLYLFQFEMILNACPVFHRRVAESAEIFIDSLCVYSAFSASLR